MIPKILHFIWFGKGMPDYAWRVMNMYKKVNPDFTVNLVHEKNVKNAVHPDVSACYGQILDTKTKYYRIFNSKQFERKHNQSAVVFNTAFSDAFRFYMLDKYGGIYLDLDTWPVKPFDDKLLENRYFHVVCDWGKGAQADLFFMGADGKTETGPYFIHPELPAQPKLLSVDVFSRDKEKREILTKKLINETIKYGEFLFKDDDTYINHLKIGKSINWFSEVRRLKGKTGRTQAGRGFESKQPGKYSRFFPC